MLEAYNRILLSACIASLSAVLLMLFAVQVFAPLWTLIRRWMSLSRIQQVLVAVFVIGLVQYGATKGTTSRITYDGGIKAGANPSYVTNDTIHIEWQRDTHSGILVPETAAVYIDYRPNAETNADWVLLGQAVVGDYRWDGTLANATNYDYNVWAYYIPPEPIHTNGVWVYKTLKDRAGIYPIPLRARIEVNGKAIATPKEARKDEEQDD